MAATATAPRSARLQAPVWRFLLGLPCARAQAPLPDSAHTTRTVRAHYGRARCDGVGSPCRAGPSRFVYPASPQPPALRPSWRRSLFPASRAGLGGGGRWSFEVLAGAFQLAFLSNHTVMCFRLFLSVRAQTSQSLTAVRRAEHRLW